ncbi:GxxExxY protein [Thiohalomonas denitrificans]|uniref:GxxExxY protein n=1 Tax=Thiohalomonas denitrificans TaxID=415747 RepID=UPI0026E9BA44|nr:GxxExxY protein [Thiohalomonas denitrificans]
MHSAIGPGLLESIYEKALALELTERGLRAETQVPIPASYRGQDLGMAFRADLIVEQSLLLELKCVETLIYELPACGLGSPIYGSWV